MSRRLVIPERAGVLNSAGAAQAWLSVRHLAVVVVFCLLIAVGAQVRIPLPMTPVPMTLQWPAVLLVGFVLSPSRALAATGLYLLCGAAGAPFFAPGSLGIWGPTGGYLVGFVVGAWVISLARGAGEVSTPRLVVAGAAGTVVLFALGLSGEVLWFGPVGLGPAITAGVIPFVPKAIVELALVVTLVRSWRGLGPIRRRYRAL
jgi:biotin transport system substrate-specific component